jgi:hypothetical protein
MASSTVTMAASPRVQPCPAPGDLAERTADRGQRRRPERPHPGGSLPADEDLAGAADLGTVGGELPVFDAVPDDS